MPLEHPFRAVSGLIIFAIAFSWMGCATRDPSGPTPPPSEETATPSQKAKPSPNPMAGLLGTLNQNPESGEGDESTSPSRVPTRIPWQSLLGAIPAKASGWTIEGKPTGRSTQIMGVSVSQVRCELKQNMLTAEIQVIDTMMNPLIAMPFNMAHGVEIDSAKERISPITLGRQPATQKYHKRRQEAEVLIMVENRILVKIDVQGAANETPAVELGGSLDIALLSELAGGQE